MSRTRGVGLDRVDAWLRGATWRSDVLLAALVAGCLLPASLGIVGDSRLGTGWAVAVPGAMVAMLVALSLRRRAPVPVFVVCALAELVLALAPNLRDAGTDSVYPAVLLPTSAAYLVAAYTVSAAGRGRWPELSLLVGVAGAVIVGLRAWATGATTAVTAGAVSNLLFLAGLLTASVVAAWALGRFRRLRAEQVLALAERAHRAEQDRDRRQRRAAADERARIARELHDVIAHSVSVMVRQAEGGRYVAARDPAAAATVLATIADTGREALTDIRSLLGVLDAEPGRIATEPPPALADLPALVERLQAAGQPVRLRVRGEPRPLDRAADLAAYRLVQEALTNVVKHAGDDVEAEAVLTWTPGLLQLRVTDRGVPARAADPVARTGRGLAGMRERLHLVGGSLTTGPAAAGGFEVVGEIPTTAARVAGGPRP